MAMVVVRVRADVTSVCAKSKSESQLSLRYFLMREMAFGQDAAFSDQAFLERYNADLANDLGNTVSRVAALCRQAYGTSPPEICDDNEIIAGHGRVAAAKLLGMQHVPALRLSHLDAAQRLRCAPEVVIAVLDADGRVVHREKDAPAAEDLTRNVARLAASHSPLELWPALIAGRASLVLRRNKGRATFLLLENPPRTSPLRAWTNAELEAVTQAARGLSTKQVSYALGRAPATISQRISSAAAKVGVASQAELVRIAAMFTRDPRASFPDANLTGAEAEILELLQTGLSNREIARERSTSIRTIANQVSALLRKTSCNSRRHLITRT